MDKEPPIGVITAPVEDVATAWKGPDRFHAILCDPPYGLGTISNVRSLLEHWLVDAEIKSSKGFMNKDWDVIPPPSVWRKLRENMCYPGAVLFAFGGTRTADLLSLSLRLGGWQKFDEILHWTYGSGYPKVHNLGKAISDAALLISDLGRETDWNSYATLLKPAQEPILCFRAPYDGTYVDRAVLYGSAGLNIDGARIDGGGYDPRTFGDGWKQDKVGKEVYSGRWMREGRHKAEGGQKGRWPANLVLTHLPGCRPSGTKKVKATKARVQKGTKEYDANSRVGAWTHEDGLTTSGYAGEDGREEIVVWECSDGCPVKEIGVQSGHLKSGSAPSTGFIRNSDKHRNTYSPTFEGHTVMPDALYGDEGTAARFFLQAHWAHEIYEQVQNVPAAFYQAKVSKSERNAGVSGEGETTDDGRQKVNDTPYQRGKTLRKNSHPTLKPIELTQWLATLLLPPESIGERRILIPYCGSGSEAIGAMLAGWDSGLGIEGFKDYARISRERLEFWWNYYRHGGDDVKKILDAYIPEPDDGPKQTRMF